ncbi:MAG: glycogen-binding domain-containing protein [Spirochaetaceae bacterium]|jgi:hypothetical protein|nr:glycogen-binding domain-containing protein [Spirochaetaceae bacterium]
MNRGKVRLSLVLLVLFCGSALCAQRAEAKNAAPVDPAEANELDLIISELTVAGPPLLKKGYLMFTQEINARYAAIVFDFENFSVIHPFTRRDMTDKEGKPAGSIYFYALKIPENMSVVAYKLIVDGLWIFDPQNTETTYDPAVGLLSQVRIPVSPQPVTGKTPGGPVRFVYQGKENQTITVSGSFTGWDPYIYGMTETSPGFYEAHIPLPPGTYLYNFVGGLKEFTDPENHERALAPGGNSASVLHVP